MQTQILVDEAVEALVSKIDDTAIIACSGGIDSSVVLYWPTRPLVVCSTAST